MKKQSGMTLIEIMVVVAIIGLLSAMILPNVLGQGEQAKVELARANMDRVANALDMYKFDNGKYPTTDEGLRALIEKPASARKWNPAGYLSKNSLPTDPWGNEYIYISPGADAPYDLFSLGADSAEGGEGFDADLSYRDSAN